MSSAIEAAGVVIVGAARTPLGAFGGALSTVSAPALGAVAIEAALSRANVPSSSVDALYFGNVCSASLGQAPARQAALAAGLPASCVCTTVNKVCASGMKAISLAASDIALGHAHVVVAGGMESMSQIPHYASALRFGCRMGNQTLVDGMLQDGLIDPYEHVHMGMFAERCAKKYAIGRKIQDEYALSSYARARNAQKEGVFKKEIVPVKVPSRKGHILVEDDEEPFRTDLDKIETMKPAFLKDGTGTVTAGNASSLNDGAAALVLMSTAAAQKTGVRPLARIRSFADAEKQPPEFTTAPAAALPVALERARVKMDQVDLFEINEAFSVVSLANKKLLNLHAEKTNVYGGAVSLGHPLGCSGARIMVTLLNALEIRNKKLGVAAICNGGGGASAMVVERITGTANL